MLHVGPDLMRLLMPRGLPAEGITLRCIALRLTAEDGMARSEALLIEGSAGRLDGSLAVNLRTEALAARLLPDLRVLGVTVRAPVGIGGTIGAPRIGVEPGQALTQVIGDTVANRLWRSPEIQWLRGATGIAPPVDACGTQLRLARLGRNGPVPAAPRPGIPGVPRELQGAAKDVVHGLGNILSGGRR